MSQRIEAIIVDLGYNLNPIAITSDIVVEVLFLNNKDIFEIPLSKAPFMGITLIRRNTVPLLDLKDMIFSSYSKDFTEEYVNKLAFVLINYNNTTIGLKINSVYGYYQLSDNLSELSIDNLISNNHISSIYQSNIDDIYENIILLNIDNLFSNIAISKVENRTDNTKEDDFDLDQFTLPDGADNIDMNNLKYSDEDLDKFTIPE